MSEAFVDVSWRGLEVGKRVKLRAIHPGDAYLDHSTPMPVGSTLTIRIDDGLEVVATVARVHEQVGGSTETPGMLVVPALAGAAAAWWQARVEAAPAPPPVVEPPVVEPPAPAPPAPAVVSPAALFSGVASPDPRAAITSRPTLTMSAVEVERARAAAAADDGDLAGRTAVMAAVDPAALDGVVDPGNAADEALVDDGRRTTVMAAVDVAAIVEAAEVETSGGASAADEDGPSVDGPTGDGPSGDGPSGDGPSVEVAGDTAARGKKKKGRRSKRNTRA